MNLLSIAGETSLTNNSLLCPRWRVVLH